MRILDNPAAPCQDPHVRNQLFGLVTYEVNRGRKERDEPESRDATLARKLREHLSRIGEDAGETLAVPRANVELFRRYEADIEKYAMNGLATCSAAPSTALRGNPAA